MEHCHQDHAIKMTSVDIISGELSYFAHHGRTCIYIYIYYTS